LILFDVLFLKNFLGCGCLSFLTGGIVALADYCKVPRRVHLGLFVSRTLHIIEVRINKR